MTEMFAARILIRCRLVVIHFRDTPHSSIRSLLRWYNHKNEVVARAIISTYFPSLTVYHKGKAHLICYPDHVYRLCSTFSTFFEDTTFLQKSSHGRTRAFIKRLTGDDKNLSRALAFAVHRDEGKSVIMNHFKMAA